MRLFPSFSHYLKSAHNAAQTNKSETKELNLNISSKPAMGFSCNIIDKSLHHRPLINVIHFLHKPMRAMSRRSKIFGWTKLKISHGDEGDGQKPNWEKTKTMKIIWTLRPPFTRLPDENWHLSSLTTLSPDQRCSSSTQLREVKKWKWEITSKSENGVGGWCMREKNYTYLHSTPSPFLVWFSDQTAYLLLLFPFVYFLYLYLYLRGNGCVPGAGGLSILPGIYHNLPNTNITE